jgi:hypothetical protein
MAFSMYDASVPLCAQQLGALAGIAGKAADHCASSKIEEAALLQDRLFPDMFCLARQLRRRRISAPIRRAGWPVSRLRLSPPSTTPRSPRRRNGSRTRWPSSTR